jgi:UDP-glucose 4-epimerase
VKLHHLVTGGAGFVGSHLTDSLIARGDSVTVLDDLSTGRLENLDQHKSNPSLTFVEGSILDMPLVNSLVAKVDHVFSISSKIPSNLFPQIFAALKMYLKPAQKIKSPY